MTINTQRITGEPIIVIHLIPPLDLTQDPMAACRAVADFKQDTGGKVYRIMDFSACKGFTFAQLAMGMAEDTQKGVEGGGADPDVISAFVAENKLVELGVKSYNTQEQYHVPNSTLLFSSVDEALAHFRKQIVKK